VLKLHPGVRAMQHRSLTVVFPLVLAGVKVAGAATPVWAFDACLVTHVLAESPAPVVRYPGIVSTAFPMLVTQGAPGIFTADRSGTGQGAILNEDGTSNSAANRNAIKRLSKCRKTPQPLLETRSRYAGLLATQEPICVGEVGRQLMRSGSANVTKRGTFRTVFSDRPVSNLWPGALDSHYWPLRRSINA
jgi:hypothetical protein